MLRTILLFVALVCLGIQAQLAAKHHGFAQVMFGSTEDTLIFFGLGVILALIFLIWAVSAEYETNHRLRHQEDTESLNEIGQTSRLPRVRGQALGRIANSAADRADVHMATFQRFGFPFLLFAIGFAALAAAILTLG